VTGLERDVALLGIALAGLVTACATRPSGNVGNTTVTREIAPTDPPCARKQGVALQILGSGGPIPDDARASAGYLVWHDGRARVLVDAGGGTFVNFGRSGAALDTLDAILLGHLHTDHSAELPAFVKAMFFMPRRDRPIVLAGPAGRGSFPGIEAFAHAMFDADTGAYRYLSWALEQGQGSADLRVRELPLHPTSTVVMESDDLVVRAIAVQHGPVPAVAYRVEIAGASLVFGGDQNGDNPQFVAFAREADVLVMHHAIPENAGPVAAHLHARPSEIGIVARDAAARRVVLSHHMQRSLRRLDHARDTIASYYDGPIVVGEDLMCIVAEQVAK
jgi:ribonuclease BN (tRNA processing enzyme)